MADSFRETWYERWDPKTQGYFKTRSSDPIDTRSPGKTPNKSTIVLGGGWPFDKAEEARVRAGSEQVYQLVIDQSVE